MSSVGQVAGICFRKRGASEWMELRVQGQSGTEVVGDGLLV